MQIESTSKQTGSRVKAQRKIIKAVLSGRCVRVLGARYSGKSQLIQEVAGQVKREVTPFVSYQTLENLKKDGWPNFYTHLYQNIAKDVLPGSLPAGEDRCATPLDLQRKLDDLLKQCDQNLVVFIDDLEIAPPNLIASLLGVIRALYMVSFSQPGAHFQAVVCGSLSFNQLALPYVSRFESVSELIMVGDLDEQESRTMLHEFCVSEWVHEDEEGTQRFLEYTGGDRYLIRQMIHFIPKVLDRSDQSALTPQVVDGAAGELLRNVMDLGTGEVIRQIESDPNLLSCVLKVLEQGRVPLRQLPLPTLEIPNMLDLSGVFSQEGQDYQIKCRLWKRILTERLDPARVGRLYALAGYWQQAIQYLGLAHASQAAEVKLDLFNATINFMHSRPNGEEAFLGLARGLQLVYPDCPFRLYQRTAASLVQIFPKEEPAPEIFLRSGLEPEVEALHGPDYTAIFDPGNPRFLFPLRVRSDSEPLGMVSFCPSFNRYLNTQHEEEIYQLIGFLRQAARAIQEADTYASNLLNAESRAEKQKNLNSILTRILHDHNLPRETIFRLVLAGVTSGHCLEFNRAILFTLDEKRQALVAQIGVGHLTRQEADQDWKKFPYKTLDELIEALLVPDYQYTRLHEKVYGKTIPVSPKANNLFARALEDHEPKVSRGQLRLEGLPQNFVETIGSTASFAIIPFSASPYLTGVLYVDNRFTLHEIGQERIFLLRGFINQAASVMELSRSLAEEKRRAGILTELLQAEEAINDQITRQVNAVYDQIAESARVLFKASSTVLNTLKRQVDGEEVIFHADLAVYKGTRSEDYPRLSRSDRGFIRHVIRQGFVHIADIDQDDDSSELADMRRSAFVKAENVRATVGVRIGPADDPEAVLHLNWDTPHLLTAEEQALITIFASFAAVTIPSARRYQQVQEDLRYRTREMEGLSQLLKEEAARRQKILETVAHITDHLAKSGSDMDSMYRNLFREVLQAIPQANNACIIQKDPDYQQYFIVPASLPFYQVQLLPNQETLKISQGTPRGIAIRVIESGRPALINDVDTDPDYIRAIPTTRSEICVPVELEGQPHAAILLESDLRGAFTRDDELLLTALAPVISIAIQRVQQMLRQREREELENMSNFATTMVHEIANAIANIPDLIKELTESLQYGEAVDEECVTDLLRSAEQAKQLSTYVRDISYVRFFKPEHQELNPVIVEAIAQVKNKAPAHVRLSYQPEQPPLSFAFDKRLILIVIKNILENALPVIPPDREGLIDISARLISGDVMIQIRDNGTGIPEADQSSVFERPFSTKKDQTQIHGFGLWLSKQIVALHKGAISFSTSPGVGTTFTVRLPLNTPQELT